LEVQLLRAFIINFILHGLTYGLLKVKPLYEGILDDRYMIQLLLIQILIFALGWRLYGRKGKREKEHINSKGSSERG
jgi:hypothetical protein